MLNRIFLVRSIVLGISLLIVTPILAQVSGNTGAYSTSIPIQVPSHRGLEPSVSLVYNSLGGNGIVGVGWGLTGFPVIERQGADGGTPQFNGTDSFRWGGEDLHPCGASSSPGCLAGGTHFTEHESYQRIIKGASDWTVDSRNGNRSTYAPIWTVAGVAYRWGLSSVTDTLGNSVAYNWLCDTGKNCYPGDATYNGYRVKFFYRSDRTDPFHFATGDTLGETRWLLRSVKVELTDGTPIRAYKVGYTTSGSTGRWLLGSVRMYGKDVAIDASGVITGGTSLPEEVFTYRTDPSAHAFTGGLSWGSCGTADRRGTGDFDGDGLQDVYCQKISSGGEITVGISDGSSFDFKPWGGFCSGYDMSLSTGDYNGDGQTDWLCNDAAGVASVALSMGSYLSPAWTSGTYCNPVFQGDFNGDGKTDIGCHGGSSYNVDVRLSTGSGFAPGTNWLPNWCRANGGTSWGINWGVTPRVLDPGDYDGDGNTDLLCRGVLGDLGPWVALSNGTNGFTHDGFWTDVPTCGGQDQRGLADFNWDGKTDIYCYDNHAADATHKTYVGLSDGSRFQAGEWLSEPLGCQVFSVGDTNGDGLSDIWCQQVQEEPIPTNFFVALSDGKDGFRDPTIWAANWCGANPVMGGDFNGDTKMDLSCHVPASSQVALSGGIAGKTDLLVTHKSSLGGTSSVTYVPGTQWTSTKVAPPGIVSTIDGNGNHSSAPSTHRLSPGGPTVSSIQVSDGRGWSATTTYAYSGGLYDEDERKWLGYQYSTETRPKIGEETSGPSTLSEFVQKM